MHDPPAPRQAVSGLPPKRRNALTWASRPAGAAGSAAGAGGATGSGRPSPLSLYFSVTWFAKPNEDAPSHAPLARVRAKSPPVCGGGDGPRPPAPSVPDPGRACRRARAGGGVGGGQRVHASAGRPPAAHRGLEEGVPHAPPAAS